MPQFKVLTAPTPEALAGPDASPRLWCGWRNLLSEPAACHFELSPLQHTYLAVKPSDGRLFPLGGACTCAWCARLSTHTSTHTHGVVATPGHSSAHDVACGCSSSH